MNSVEQLNHQLGLALGFAGAEPRWKWVFAPDAFYLEPPVVKDRGFRADCAQDPVRRNWASKVGRVWLLAQWKPPDQYGPARYHCHAETALAKGEVPTPEITRELIRVLDFQMSEGFANHLRAINDSIAEEKERDQVSWVEYVQNFNPAFSNFAFGKRGGHVSYGGF
jgi:hypothetical protein